MTGCFGDNVEEVQLDTMGLLHALCRAPTDARIVLQLPNGDEVDVTDARCHCQLVVLRADVPEPEPLDNSAHIEEAMAQFPSEDFLGTAILSIRALKFPPRMAEYKDTLIETLEEIQSEIARAAEYGREELVAALAEIEQD